MLTNPGHFRFIGNKRQLPSQGRGFLGRLLTAITSVAVLALAFMFSIVIFALVAIAVLAFGTYVWWKTRALRRVLREKSMNEPPLGGRVIEGEVVPDPRSGDSDHR
jgi:Flp pilus assembly protein TadB